MDSEVLYKDRHAALSFFLWVETDLEGHPKGRATVTEEVIKKVPTAFIYIYLRRLHSLLDYHAFMCLYLSYFSYAIYHFIVL